MSFKFNVGDKVQVCSDIRKDPSTTMIGFAPAMRNYQGKVATIVERFPSFRGENAYYIDIDEGDRYGRWVWAEAWLEPVKLVTISFDPSDKVAAHKAVEEAIKDFYTPKDWTHEEISSAKNLVGDMVQKVFMSGGDVTFDDACQENTLVCVVHPDCFTLEESCGRSAPHGKDIYNIWIGKCVALCKALHRPIPDFIRLKNT